MAYGCGLMAAGCWLLAAGSPSPRTNSEKILQPRLHALREAIDARRVEREPLAADGRGAERESMGRVLREPGHRREARRLDTVREAPNVLRRHANAHAGTEHVARELDDALHRRRAAREH